MTNRSAPRGMRNHNWGNIDWVETNKWQGQVGIEAPPLDGGPARFARFSTPEFGVRALAMLLITYQDRHNLRTIRGIISRWAPGNENPTAAYIAFVARRTGFDPDQELDLHSYATMRPLAEAIVRKELGLAPPNMARVLDEGLRMAGIRRPVASMAEAAGTSTGRGAISVAAVTAVATGVAPAVQSLSGLHWAVGVAIVLAACVGGVAWVLRNRKEA
jgi:hypothetical protein